MSSESTHKLEMLASGKVQENNMQRDLKMKRKRLDADVEGSPCTMIQGRGNITHSTDHSNVQEDAGVPSERRSHRGKRKASDDGERPRQKMRRDDTASTPGSHTTDPSVRTVEIPLEIAKRKASDDGEQPRKKVRCDDTTSTPESGTPESSSGQDLIPNSSNTLTEEERIFEMSSSANTSRADFERRYSKGEQIGKGGFGSVYEGYRRLDNLPVAIKYILTASGIWRHVISNGKVYDIIFEVAFMLKAAGLPGSVGQSAAMSLLDCYILDEKLILVMERSPNSMDLCTYHSRGPLHESWAKVIMKQLVDAAIDMHSKGIFHQDIKLQNVLVVLDNYLPRVRVIDFGCSDFSKDTPYHYISGTRPYYPPEWSDYQKCWACPTTVWHLGALCFTLLRGEEFFTTSEYIANHVKVNR